METVRHLGTSVFKGAIPPRFRPHLRSYAQYVLNEFERFRFHGLKNKDLPLIVEVETNRTCTKNPPCYYCPRPTDKEEEMPKRTYRSIIEQLAEAGFRGRFSPHSYNEPLTDKRIFEFIAYARKQLPSSGIALYTNGDLLDAKTVDELILSGVSDITVSLHEPTPEAQEMKLREISKQYDIVTIIDRRDGKRDMPLSDRGGSVGFKETYRARFCHHINMMVIRANGNLILCCQDAKEQYILGNVEEENILSIWNKHRALREEIRKGRYTLPICLACGHEKI